MEIIRSLSHAGVLSILSTIQNINPNKWTYLYDHSPLIKTLEKYVDFNKLQPNGNPNSRLIITAVNILTAKPLAFDSSRQQITPKHILLQLLILNTIFNG